MGAALGAGALAVTAALAWPASAPADSGRPVYLALGDSVVYGFITSDGFAYVNPSNFTAYPQLVADATHMTPVNAGCPGEATAGFLSTTGADNGCRTFKSSFPLHVSYNGATTQMSFALNTVRSQHVSLVTIGLGANDGFIVQNQCATAANGNPLAYGYCLQQALPTLAQTVGNNLKTIIGNLRGAGYHGRIVLVNYYSTDYSQTGPTSTTALSQFLNSVIAGAAAGQPGVRVADAFSVFQTAAAAAGGNTCHAGLLNVDPKNSALPTAGCDVHPSLSGQALLAQAVENTLIGWHYGDDSDD